jgi:exopolysaccharide production protein ExoZ
MVANLQVLRLVAAVVVLFGHTVDEAGGIDPRFTVRYPGGVDYGIGVDVFFVISGAVMVLATTRRFGEAGGTRRFWRDRLLRVAPLYWVFTAAMVLATLLVPERLEHGDLTPGRVLTSVLFIPWDDGTGSIRPVLRLGWTLDYEVFFYALFGLALLVRRRGTALVALAATMVGLVLLHPLVPETWWPLHAWTESIILEFLLGVAVGLLVQRGLRLPLPVAVLVAVVAVVGWFAERDLDLPRPLAMGVPAALLALAAACGPQLPQGPRWARALMVGGAASYALYLAHPFAINAVLVPWERVVDGHPWAFVGVAMAVALVTALAVHWWVERPLLARSRAWARRVDGTGLPDEA